MPLPVGSKVQVTFVYSHFLQRLMNTTHWLIETAGTSPQAQATQEIATYFGNVGLDSPMAKILRIVPNTVTVEAVRAQIISPNRYSYYEVTPFAVGLRGASSTANIDVAITKRTDQSGRREVGSFYLPGIDPEDMAAGLITDAFKTDIITRMGWLKERQTMTVSGATLAPIIYHRLTGTASDITSYHVHDEVRVMTRRTVGRGE